MSLKKPSDTDGQLHAGSSCSSPRIYAGVVLSTLPTMTSPTKGANMSRRKDTGMLSVLTSDIPQCWQWSS